MLLGWRPVRLAQEELELRGDERVDAGRSAALDLCRQHAAGRQGVGYSVFVLRISEHQRVTGAMGQHSTRCHIGTEVGVEITGVDVDELVVGQVVLHVEHEHGVSNVGTGLIGAVEESPGRNAFASQVPLRVWRRELDGVDLVVGDHGGEVTDRGGNVDHVDAPVGC